MQSKMLFKALVLACLLNLSHMIDSEYLEQVRQLHDHDGIDTASVHIAYPHSPTFRRLTKRETQQNVLSHRYENFTVKLTLESTGHVLNLRLSRSRLGFHGAKVTVRHEATSYSYLAHDKRCHYEGGVDGDRGFASVHFCKNRFEGAAYGETVSYVFHPHPDDDVSDGEEEEVFERPYTSRDALPHEDLPHRAIISWKRRLEDVDFPVDGDAEREDTATNGRHKREARDDSYYQEGAGPSEGRLTIPDGYGLIPAFVTNRTINRNYDQTATPVVELGIIVDQDFMATYKDMFRTKEKLLNFLITKFTGVQGLFNNPNPPKFHLRIKMKMVEIWYENPPWYQKNPAGLSMRFFAAKRWQEQDPDVAGLDVVAIFTDYPSGPNGLAYYNSVCLAGDRFFLSKNFRMLWITEAHELGHVLGLDFHSCPGDDGLQSSSTAQGFMNSAKPAFLPCYKKRLDTFFRYDQAECLFTEGVKYVDEPFPHLPTLYPVVAFGLNHFCRVAFLMDSEFIEHSGGCGDGLCAVLNETSPDFGLAQAYTAFRGLDGRPCGSASSGKVCLDARCTLPSESGQTVETEIPANLTDGTGTWGAWQPYSKTCSAVCGTGLKIATRQCDSDRVEACLGSKFKAMVCNEQPCPGDQFLSEEEVRQDRANYTCNLLKGRRAFGSAYFLGHVEPDSIDYTQGNHSCVVRCAAASAPKHLVRKDFGSVFLADGTPCGPVRVFERHVRHVYWRCLRGSCVKFGCDGNSASSEGDGAVKERDICGVCGGRQDTCTVTEREGNTFRPGVTRMKILVPGTTAITMALEHSYGNDDDSGYLNIAVTDTDDHLILAPDMSPNSTDELFNIPNNEHNPLNYAGTFWTMVDRVILTAPGPIDRPAILAVRNTAPRDVSASVWITSSVPQTDPLPPTCKNSGVLNSTTGGCTCTSGVYYGRQCEYRCYGMCLNGGKLTEECHCDCRLNARTEGERCRCRQRFGGPDCHYCLVSRCANGGVLDQANCVCLCPSNCGGRDCSQCNYNEQLPSYYGHYGKGPLELTIQVFANITPESSGATGIRSLCIGVWPSLLLAHCLAVAQRGGSE